MFGVVPVFSLTYYKTDVMNSRRKFLQTITASAIALPVLRQFETENKSQRSARRYDGPVLRVAIMGLGSYGNRVAEAMVACTSAKLTGVISGTPSKIKDWQTKYNIPEKNCYNYENFDAIKNNPDIDAVYIITPNGLHREQAIRVAKAGKHVICEKPMALNADEGKDMVEACNRPTAFCLLLYTLLSFYHSLLQ